MTSTTDPRLIIARKLKELREQNNLTQTDLGRLVGKAFSTVASWESGKGQPDADTLLRLLSLYRVENVLEEFGYAPPSSPLSTQEREHIENLRALKPAARELIYHLVGGLSEMEAAEEFVLPIVARGGKNGMVTLPESIASLPDEGWKGMNNNDNNGGGNF